MSTGLEWFKSSYSGSDGGNCLEVSPTPAAIHIRDSKNISADAGGTGTGTGTGIVTVTPAAWAAFLPLARRSR
ncbi:DUF397 domain-containing protein [Streptomyces sp. NPDC048527]|uniref:DUF397 domain-containing protein n=1 Tax=Streptomyces sp. NPDC048527 TaxID=3365568 RepID=UPI0037221B42